MRRLPPHNPTAVVEPAVPSAPSGFGYLRKNPSPWGPNPHLAGAPSVDVVGYLIAAPADLIAALGPPASKYARQHDWPYAEPPEFRAVTTLWCFAEKDTVLCLYDWKMTSRYQGDLPAPAHFRRSKQPTLFLVSSNKAPSAPLVRFLEDLERRMRAAGVRQPIEFHTEHETPMRAWRSHWEVPERMPRLQADLRRRGVRMPLDFT